MGRLDSVILLLTLILVCFAGACGDGRRGGDGTDAGIVRFDASAMDGGPGMDAAVPICPDYIPPRMGATLCRSTADCAAIGSCYTAGSGCCPVGMIAPRECESDIECAGTDVCEEYRPTAACTSGVGTRCTAACNTGEGCTDGACAMTGHCVPLACPDEWTCPTNYDCAASSPSADEHGCVPRGCAIDGECECGACVNGVCQGGPGQCSPDCACAAPDTPIATPQGERPIADLRAGDLVYTVDGEATVVAPILRAGRRLAPENHVVVHVLLDDGRAFEMSPGHPTADGRTLGDLVSHDRLGGAAVVETRLVPYRWSHTYDILPASSSGSYFAAGALVGSTLQ